MQYQQTPQGLAQMFDANVANGGGSIAATPAMMGLWAQQQQADQMTQQDQGRQLAYDTANDPLKLAHQGLINDTMSAQLPGVQAQSRTQVRNDANDATTNDAKIKDILGKYKSADIARHVADTEQFGTRLSQMGEEAFSNPMGAAARVKAELEKMGHGDLWNPAWETSSPGLLARQLSDYGKDIQGTSAKFSQALSLQDKKNEGMVDRATIAADASKKASADRLAAAQKLAETKKDIANMPKGLEDYAAKMMTYASEEEDPQQKAMYAQEAQKALARKQKLVEAAAAVNNAGKPDLERMAQIPTMGTRTPAFAGAQDPLDAPISSGQGASVPGFPAGAVVNPDGSVTYNGKTYRKK